MESLQGDKFHFGPERRTSIDEVEIAREVEEKALLKKRLKS